jgi:hypothetical protein
MAVQRFKLAINAARFPLVSTKGSRAVITPGLDAAPRTPRQYVGNDYSVDYNTAQVLYMENVIPVSEGLRSVGYRQRVPASPYSGFNAALSLRDTAENVQLFSPAGGQNYVCDPLVGTWTASPVETVWGMTVSPTSPNQPYNSQVTTAYVNGITVICYSLLVSTTNVDMSLMFWDDTLKIIRPANVGISNIPFAPGGIAGISSSNGFLLMWSALSVAWAPWNGSQFNFSPYENGEYTGSGVQIPEDAGGLITALIPVSGGFIIFTARNAVAAIYNPNNLVSPWAFKEIGGAGGIANYEQATIEGSLAGVYAFTTAGLQRITLNSAENVFPAVADFISGRVIERFNSGTKALTQTNLADDLFTKVTNIGNRYIVVSYGVVQGSYEYALVYDLTLERWGKLKFTHVDCFNYGYLPVLVQPGSPLISAQHSIAFLQANGSVHLAEWTDNVGAGRDSGVVIVGRVSLSRSRGTQLNRVEVERTESANLSIIPSYDGATNEAPIPFVQVSNAPNLTVYGELVDCKNFNILLEGAFNLSTIILEGQPTGQV